MNQTTLERLEEQVSTASDTDVWSWQTCTHICEHIQVHIKINNNNLNGLKIKVMNPK